MLPCNIVVREKEAFCAISHLLSKFKIKKKKLKNKIKENKKKKMQRKGKIE